MVVSPLLLPGFHKCQDDKTGFLKYFTCKRSPGAEKERNKVLGAVVAGGPELAGKRGGLRGSKVSTRGSSFIREVST